MNYFKIIAEKLIIDDNGENTNETSNIIYKKVFQNL